MPKTYEVDSLQALGKLFARHQAGVAKSLVTAARRTAKSGKGIVADNVPVAFGELRRSLADEPTATGARIVAEAPHAAAVEVGSRPHTPPLEPLIRWVKLRAAQGLLSERQLAKKRGSTTAGHAHAVAGRLKSMEHGGALDVEAPRRIAFAIQRKIAREGTLPSWFARRSIAPVVRALDGFVKQALFGSEDEGN